ncbi:UNKNOWN [Stylonychia lemnae]|uniref:Mitochondrial import inner membrane translocase subunit n=1 Tax=Stylonychia lemnae TaxID=5949 RepID=A0A078AHR6_STYLE|nr:UNKNOWN [Stylonychia lemnae]|eukprot:CDW81794.1 UNKNOWN [Stylonychia lemnae]
MRQPGQEFRVDPSKSTVFEVGTLPQLPWEVQQESERYLSNNSIMKQHKFCANLCINFKTGSELLREEQNCMQTCFSKYQSAMDSYYNERNIFQSQLADLKARGLDVYEARDI